MNSSDRASARHPVTVALGAGDVPDSALQLAVNLAVRESRGLRLAHVTPKPRGTAAQEWPLLDFKAIELLSEQVIEAAAQRVLFMTETPIEINRAHESGSVVKALTELSQVSSHVVLTRRRLSQLRRIFNGSISTHLAAHSPVPVISVPEFWAPWHQQRPHIVACASRQANAGLFEYAVHEAAARGCELDVVHAWTLPIFDEETWIIRDEAEAWEAEVQAELLKELDEAGLGRSQVRAHVHVMQARPVDAVVDASRNADLVLVGRSGEHGHLASLTRSVLREAHCPVEVVPAGVTANSRELHDPPAEAHA